MDMVGMGHWLDWVILEVFSDLDNSMSLHLAHLTLYSFKYMQETLRKITVAISDPDV